MYRYLSHALRVLCVSLAVVGPMPIVMSQQQPHFAGAYELTSIVEDGSEVHFTLKFTLLNPGNTDVKGGILALLDSQPNSLVIGEVATIASLPHLGQISVTKNFTVSADEYARWQSGHEPRFDFLVPANDGAMDVRVQSRHVVNPPVKTN